MFVFPDTSLLNFGYASLNNFFEIAPMLLLFLVPTVTMRSFADEYKQGTFELLKTLPLTPSQIVWGKFFGAAMIVITALLPTIVYVISMQQLSSTGGIDVGGTIGSYIGLILISTVFVAVGLCSSSFTNNTVVAFITGAFVCFILYSGFDAISKLPVFKSGWDYYIEMLGLNFHYKSVSRGVIDTRDVIYFIGVIFLFLLITQRNIVKK